MSPWLAAALVVVVGAGMGAAARVLRNAGYEACRAEQNEALAASRREAVRAADLASRKEEARLAADATAQRLAQELEDLANAAPVDVPMCLSVDRVRRLDSR